MRLLRDAEEFFDRAALVRSAAKGLSTNLYAMPSEVQSWSAGGEVTYLEHDTGLLVIRADRDFAHLYHVAVGEAGLAGALDALDGRIHETLVTELVGRGEETLATAKIYRSYGFRDYTTLFRMTKALEASPLPLKTISEWYAQDHDAPAIGRFLESILDPLRDHIPIPAEIEGAVESERVLVEKNKGCIEGVLFFENKGATSTLRYWYVDRGCQNDGVGGRLMREYLRLCQGKRRILLWVVSDNHAAIDKYQHYGFRFDGLVDRIMVRIGRA